MKSRFVPYGYLGLLLLVWLAAGCNRAKVVQDSEINSTIQSKFDQDSGLQGKPLTVTTAGGVVTIDGTVNNAVERDAAGRLAASVEGVKTVVNNLRFEGQGVESTNQSVPANQLAQTQLPKSEARSRRAESTPPELIVPADERLPQAIPAAAADTNATPLPSEPVTPAPSPAPAPVPPAPARKVTLPANTIVKISLIDKVDSETSQVGQTFRASLSQQLSAEGDVAVPVGSDVQGHVVEVKSAGKFAGQSVLVLQLDRITVGGTPYDVQSNQYRAEGASRGKDTAKKVGGAAAIGAVIGGIIGGGKGAVIGGGTGAGIGTGVQAATQGQAVNLDPETQIEFTLTSPLAVVPSAEGPRSSRQRLDKN